jgi:hypothetical protein
MDTLLIVITVVSSLVAVAMSVTGWRARREEARRAAARVAALSAAASVEPAGNSVLATSRVEPVAAPAVRGPHTGEALASEPSRGADLVTPAEPSTGYQPLPRSARQVPLRADDDVRNSPHSAPYRGPTLGDEFLGGGSAAPKTSTSHQRGLVAAAALFAIGLTAAVAVRMSGGPAVVAPVVPAAPLELLSLRHERQGGRLSVAGLVRNPPAGIPVERLVAVVLLFDQQGTFVTSSTAPVDFLRLSAGDESPFVVKLDAPQSVARYRVSFRTDNGTMSHVDRRGEPPLATPVSLGR